MKKDRKEKFSIRKFSFGAASCLIGATIALTSLSSKEVQAMSTTVVGDNGGTSVIYANWDDNPLKTNTNSSVSVNDEIVMKVDTSKYTKNDGIVTVTYYFNKNFTKNADGSIIPTGTDNNIVRRGGVNWLGHRPDYWFTVPKGFSEPTSIKLTNAKGEITYMDWASWRNSNSRSVASRYQSEADAKAMNNGSPDNWSRYNDTTKEGPIWEHNGSLNWYLNTRAGYGWDDGSDKEAYERLRNNTRSIYSDWENPASDGAVIQVTYKVKDPVNTQYVELGAGVHINAGGIDHVKIETIALPDVDDTPENQKYAPNKLPARQGVKDTTSLTPEEKATLKAALKEKNPLLENRIKGGLDNGISIADDGTATFTYTDNTTDTIPGKELVYKKFLLDQNKHATNSRLYIVEQIPVDDYNNISLEDRKRADKRLGELNGFTPDYTKKNYDTNLFNRSRIIAGSDYKMVDKDFAKWDGDKLRIGGAEYFGRGLEETNGVKNNSLIPKEDLFVQIPKADDTAKQKAKDLINGLQNLTDKEKEEYKKKIDQLPANSPADKINEIVNEALKKDAENKALKEAKEEAKKVVAALPNLTNEEKDAAKREIDNATTTDAVTAAKDKAIAKDLEKEKEKAKKRIDQIKGNLANPDDYKNQITAATTKDKIAEIVRKAEDEAAKKQVEKNKAEADTVRDEAKKKIDAIPGLTEAEKKHFKDLIDGANTKGQIDKIVEDAKQYADSKAKREAVKKEIENLPHLNKAQKADFIESINATDDIPTISDLSTKAHNLDARMGRLQDLVEYAKGNEVTAKYNESDDAKKQAFNKAKAEAEKIADKENATDNAGVDLVQKLYKDLEDAIKALGIDPVVLKTNKDALRAEIALNDNDAIKKGNPYKLATSDEKRTAYDRAFEKAKEVLNKDTATQDEINQAVRDLQNARYALDGKVADFTLKTIEGAAEISVKPQEGATLTNDADKNLVKSKVKVTQNGTEGNVLDTDEVFYGNITSKDGKFYVPVTVGRDKVYHIVDVEVKEFALAVKDSGKPVEISKAPVAGESLTEADQAKVKAKVTANGEELKDTDTVAYGPIEDKNGKKVVPVTVTRDGVAKTIEVEVTKKAEEFTLAVTAGAAEISVEPKVGAELSEADKGTIKAKVTANGEALKGTDTVTYGPIEDKNGKKVVPVTVTRDGVAKTIEVEVIKKAEDFTLAVTAGAAEISVEPKVGAELSEADKGTVKAKVTANGKALDNTYTVEYGTIADKNGKKVVPVTVTRDGVSKTMYVEVTKKAEEFTLAVTAGAAEISVEPKVGAELSEADKGTVKAKVTANGKALDNTYTVEYGTIADKNGKKVVPVKVTRDGVAKTIEVEVTKKAEDFTLTVKEPDKPVEISKAPVAGENLTAEDEAKVKAKVTANGEALKATDTVEYGKITDKDGKKVVPVKVTRDGVSKTIEVEVTKKAEEFTLAVKDGAAKISVVPKAGESLTEQADKDAVKEKVTANGKALKDTDTVEYGKITDKDGKKVVPVKVTRDGVTKTVEVLVVKKEDSTDSSGSQGNQNGQGGQGSSGSQGNQNGQGGQGDSGSQGNQNGQGGQGNSGSQGNQNDQGGQGGSGSQGNQNGQGGQGSSGSQGNQNGQGGSGSQGNQNDQGGQGDSGSQGNQNGQGGQGDSNTGGPTSPGVSADQSDLDKAKEKAKSDLTAAANKEKEEIDADKNLTDKEKADKKTEVDNTKKAAEANIDKATTPEEVAKATEEGKKAIDAVHKTDADKSTPTITSGEVPVSVDPSKDKKVAEADKKAITDAVEVPKDQPQPTDKQVKNDGAIVDGTGANAGKKVVVVEVTYPDGSKDEIEVPVRKATDKEKAKADLTDAANAEKGEISGDTTLTDKEKEDLKAKVDEVKKAAEDKINNAKTPEEIAKATEEGKKAIADVYNPQTSKGKSTSIFKPELDLQTALVSGKATVEKGKDLTDEEILKQLALADGVTAKITSKPTTTETGTKEAEVEVTLADGTKVTVKVPVEVVASLDTADKDNDLAKAKEDAKKQVEDAAKKKLEEIKKDKDLTDEQKQKAEKEINKAKDEANKAIDEASSAGTAKQIADQAKENIEKYNPKADTEVKKPDVTNLDEEKAKAKAEILEEAQKRINEIKNNKDLTNEEKQKAIEAVNKAKEKAIEDINKGQFKDEINAAKEAGIHKINEVQPEGSIASKFEPKVPENKVEVKNPTKLSDEEREQIRRNIEGANTFPDGTTVEVKPDGTAVITYKDGSTDTISKDKLVTPANQGEGTIASRTEPVIPGKTQVGNTTKLTPEEQAAVKKAVEEANNFPAGTTVEVRPDGTVVITYPDKSVDTITGDKLVEKSTKQATPKVKTDAEKNPAQVPGNFVPVENTHSLTQAEQDKVEAKVKQANPAATDVKVSKDGTATLTYADGSVNTIPGTSLVVAKDTDNETTTQAAQNPAVVPATTTEVGNAHNLTPAEQSAVAAKVQAANPAAKVTVSKDGTATLTYGDGSVNTIPGTSLVVQKEEVPAQDQPTIAEKTKVIIPANPTKVAEATRLTDEEKEAVRKAVVEANGFGSDVNVEVAGDGTATIIFKDGSAITIPGSKLVAQDPKAQDSNKTDAEKTTVKAPAQRVDVKDITHLTDEEKEKVKVAILQANGSALDGATINVAGDGTATITFPDGSVATILGKDTVQQSAKTEPAIEDKPEYTPDSTPGGDNGNNGGSGAYDANAGADEDMGAANADANSANKENAKGGIQGALAHTGLDNAGGLGLAGLGLAMLSGLLATAKRRKEK